jgi:hypothetical protein
MSENLHLEALIREYAVREAVHADLFTRIAPEAICAQDDLFFTLVKDREALRKQWAELDMFPVPPLKTSEDDPSVHRIERFRQRLDSRMQSADTPVIRADSHVAKAMTLQPVRDIVVDGILVLSEDRKLDIIGSPYPNFWTSKSGNAFPALQSVWADPGDGTLGFSHEVHGTVTGRQANSGAGLYVQFVPRIAPGIAQIRPYIPYSYNWSTLSWGSREDTSATLGLRVWSWDLAGGDFATEQDYIYPIWNSTTTSSHNNINTSQSPSWYENPDDGVPGWDDDNGFLFGKEAPYFKTRANRVYMAAIWCFGVCWSVSPENRPGWSTGRLHAKVPWVVIGYQ